MSPSDFSPESPGDLVKNLSGHWTFVPKHLPPELSFDESIASVLARAEREIGRLDGLAQSLPDPAVLVRAFVRREASLTSAIENTFADYGQLARFEVDPASEKDVPDVREVHNAEKAILHGLTAVREHGRAISQTLIREMHAVLLDDVRGGQLSPGRYRDRQVYIGAGGATIESARFVPAPPALVPEAMEALERYVQRGENDRTPSLVRIALTHYQFEAIHPFLDGNGRLGRAIILLQLVTSGLRSPAFNPSVHFERHRRDYYDLLLDVSRRGRWRDWILYFVEGMAVAATDAVARIDALLSTRAGFLAKVAGARSYERLARLVDLLMVNPTVTVKSVAEQLDVAIATATDLVNKLVDAGVLIQATEGSRNRVFVADAIAKVMENR